jgi:hypothetical protein
VFRSKNTPSSSIVGQKAASWDNLRGNLFGLGGRVQFVDRLGAADEGIVRAQNAGVLSSLEAETAQYFMRLADATSQTAGQFITSGPVQIVSEKIGNSVEERYQSQTGSNLVRVAEHIDTAAKAGLGDSAEIATTVIMAGNRANSMTNGWERLNAENPAGAKPSTRCTKPSWQPTQPPKLRWMLQLRSTKSTTTACWTSWSKQVSCQSTKLIASRKFRTCRSTA